MVLALAAYLMLLYSQRTNRWPNPAVNLTVVFDTHSGRPTPLQTAGLKAMICTKESLVNCTVSYPSITEATAV